MPAATEVLENRGPWLSTAMALFLAWSIMMMVVRAWAKLRTKQWALDDYVLTGALVVSIVQESLLWRAIAFGYGHASNHLSAEQLNEISIAMYSSQIFYILSLGLCRVAAALFVAHMTYYSHVMSKPANIMAVLNLFWTGGSIISIAIRDPIKHPWTTLEGTAPLYSRWIGIETSGLLVEVVLWVLSVNLVWGLQMKIQRRIFVLIAFAARLILIPIVATRLILLSPDRNDDPSITSILPNILTVGAVQASIIASCVTSLKPFLTAFTPPQHSYPSKGGSVTVTKDSYHRLDTFRRIDKSPGVSDDSANWRPFQGESHATAYPNPVHHPTSSVDIRATGRRSSSKHAIGNLPKVQKPRKMAVAEPMEEPLEHEDLQSEESGSERLIIQINRETSIQFESRKAKS